MSCSTLSRFSKLFPLFLNNEPRSSEMATDSFAVFSAVAYTADPIEPFPLLQRHFKRLRTAFEAFAKEVPACWCASVAFPSHEAILQELNRCTAAGGVSNPQRVSLAYRRICGGCYS